MLKSGMRAIVVGLAVLLLVAPIAAQGPGDPPCDFGWMWSGRGGMMNGMMGGGIPDECLESGFFGMGMMGGRMGYMGMGQGMMGMMMGGFDHMRFGPGTGMMGAWTPPVELAPAGEALTLDEAVAVAAAYIAAWEAEQPLELGEVMQFDNHFYAEALETETGLGAFEFLIDPTTATVFGEPGPNMMWNLRYGADMGMSMGLWGPPQALNAETMTITPEEAQAYAQAYLDETLPGTEIDHEAEAFYGYYTLHILRDGEIIGMLGVNGFSGQVWLHHWHGDFIAMTGHDDIAS